MTPTLVLAVVLGSGAVPISEATMRFPNADTWSGGAQQRVVNMLADINESQGNRMATSGPGPQQLAARWERHQLNQAERVAVLLGAAVFHHPATLPIYLDGLRSPILRERRAAIVGLAWYLGVAPPDPNTIGDDSPVAAAAVRTAEALLSLSRERTLVELWCESYLVARGLLPAKNRVVLSPDPSVCLQAIREVAVPEDLADIVALWPVLPTRDRSSLMTTLEMITMQQFYLPPGDPQAPTGDWLFVQAEARVDAWIKGMCAPVDGWSLALGNLTRAWPLQDPPEFPYQPLLTALEGSYEPLWFLPTQLLVAYGGRSVDYDRQRPNNPRNRELRNRIKDAFAVSKSELRSVQVPRQHPAPRPPQQPKLPPLPARR